MHNLNHCVAMPGTNPFQGYTPEIPDGEKLDFGSESFQDFEQQGIPCVLNMSRTAISP